MSVLTMEKLLEAKALMESMPKPPRLYTTKFWPPKQVTTFTHEGEQYVIGHPSMWDKVPVQIESPLTGLWGLQVRDLDHPSHDRDRERVFGALFAATALMPTEPPAQGEG